MDTGVTVSAKKITTTTICHCLLVAIVIYYGCICTVVMHEKAMTVCEAAQAQHLFLK